MDKKTQYLKEWRTFRKLTQAQVVDRLAVIEGDVPKTEASLSRLENSKQPYSEGVLIALASIYDTEPGYLIQRNPNKEGEIIDLISRLDSRRQSQASAILQALGDEAESA